MPDRSVGKHQAASPSPAVPALCHPTLHPTLGSGSDPTHTLPALPHSRRTSTSSDQGAAPLLPNGWGKPPPTQHLPRSVLGLPQGASPPRTHPHPPPPPPPALPLPFPPAPVPSCSVAWDGWKHQPDGARPMAVASCTPHPPPKPLCSATTRATRNPPHHHHHHLQGQATSCRIRPEWVLTHPRYWGGGVTRLAGPPPKKKKRKDRGHPTIPHPPSGTPPPPPPPAPRCSGTG